MTDVEHAKKYAEESISLAISMYNPKAEIIAETACLYGLTYKNERIAELEEISTRLESYYQNQKVRIEELEAQIEKMKCCENCRYCNEWGEANSNSPNCKKCNWVSNWKLRR